jgi:hypothetical protein
MTIIYNTLKRQPQTNYKWGWLKIRSCKAVNPNDFSYGGNGYAQLSVYENRRQSYFWKENNKEN